MRNVLQETSVSVGKNEHAITVLIHAEPYILAGDFEILCSEFSKVTPHTNTATAFNYILAFNHSNHVIYPDDLPVFEEFLQRSKKGEEGNYSFRVLNAKGEMSVIEGHGSLRSMKISGLADIAFETSSLGMIWLEAKRNEAHQIENFRVAIANRMAETQLGFSLLGKDYSALASNITIKHLHMRTLIDIVETDGAVTENILYTHEQKQTWLIVTLSKFKDGVFMILQDNTRNRSNEDQIKHQNVLLSKVIESSPDIIEIVNLQTRSSIYINKMLLEDLNYPFHEIKRIELERSVNELIHPDDSELYNNFIKQISGLGSNDTVEVQLRWRSFNTGWKWYKTRARIFERAQDGTPLKYLAFSQDISNQKTAEEDKRKFQIFKDLEKARTAFFNNVSHEFRTPLTLLLAPLQEMMAQQNLPKADLDKVELAYRNTLRLQKLVNNLLDFSRIEAGKLDAVFKPTDLAKHTTDLASNFTTLIQQAGLKFQIKCAPLAEPIYINHEMYEKILFNLISNAFKFTFRGKIEVIIKENKHNVKLMVRDTGVGIKRQISIRYSIDL